MADFPRSSAAITNLDAVPVVPNTTGEGAQGYLREASGSLTGVAADGTGSVYRFVRVASTVKVKTVHLEAGDMGTTGALNVGVHYATNHKTGAGAVIDADFFASAVVTTTAVPRTDITNEGGFYPINKRVQPLWQAVGLSADPGGYFDITAMPSAAGDADALIGVGITFVD